MRWIIGRWAVVAAIVGASLSVSGQGPALRIVSAAPTGEIGQLADADEVRIVFSEPMVAIGTASTGAPPPWLRMTPAAAGSFYWSGTKTLIFSPDASRPLRHATTFTVEVAASTASLSGRRLGAPYVLTFTTPTVRLLGADWYRKTARYDSPAIIALRFNQPVRPADVVAHTKVALTPHTWNAPVLSPGSRERLRQADPAGLEQFDRKVAAAARVASSTDPLEVRIADAWDERRFPPDPSRVVLETTTVPPTEAWLTIALDGDLPSPEGSAKHAAQSTQLRLEPTFFVTGTQCQDQCNALVYNQLAFTRPVALGTFARAVRVAEVTGTGAVPVAPEREPSGPIADRALPFVRLEDAGFSPAAPARTRRVSLDAAFEATDGQTLGYPWTIDIAYGHVSPSLAFTGEVWEASGGPLLPVSVRNVVELDHGASTTSPAAIVPLLQQLRQPKTVSTFDAQPTRLSLTPNAMSFHGLDLRSLLSRDGTGLVHAAVGVRNAFPGSASPIVNEDRSRVAILQVTNLGVSVKDSPQGTLAFVTRLDTGAPVDSARVSIIDGSNKQRWQGTTDSDGVAVAPALDLRLLTRPADFAFIVTAEKDGDVAYVGSDWSADVHPRGWNINYQLSESLPVLRGSVFTDRGVYKEGEDVRVKAVLRDDTPTGIRLLPEGTALDVVVRDARGRESDRRTLKVNRWSSVEWVWPVPKDSSLGNYRVVMSRAATPGAPSSAPPQPGSSVEGRFLVAAFRKPDFRVDATLEGKPAVLGSTLSGTAQAKYLFGATLGARPVRWFFRRTITQNPPQAVRERYPDSRYAVGYMPRPEELARRAPDPPLPQKTESLGPDGRIAVELPTVAEGAAAYTYTFEGDVEDASGQHIANRASLVVHPASLYVAVSRPLTFVSTVTGANVGISAVDLDGNRVADVTVTVSLVREDWTTVRRPENPGIVALERREVPAGEWTVRSANAESPLQIPVRAGGCYILRAIARDAVGRETRTELMFYATGSGVASWRDQGNRIALTPERTTWKPGETARLLIQSPWSQATALLTVEREGIRSHRRFEVRSTQDVVEVPITEAHVPNVFVSVLLVRGRTSNELAPDGTDYGKPSYRVGYAELTVDEASKRLDVTVSSDRDDYRPGQPVNVSVSVASTDGRRAPREVTLWAMDYGILSLTNYRTPDILKQIYVRKALQVMTQDNRQRLIARREKLVSAERMVAAPAAGGGRGGGAGVAGGVFNSGVALDELQAVAFTLSGTQGESETSDVEIRRDFRPLVFWLGSTTTDENGRAAATVKLPDSLTTYRIMAVAGDEASQFGFAEREVQVSKPLTLMPSFPRFLNVGDRASFAAVVTNSGRQSGEAAISIQSFDPATLQLIGVDRRSVTLAGGASVPVTFDAMARGRGQPRVRMTVTMGGDTDAFEMPLPIRAPLRAETTAAYGETVGRATERLALPASAARDAGGLSIELASTALVGLGEGARYVTDYPFDFAEVRASQALALLLASDLGAAFRLSAIKPEDYRAEALTKLQGLYAFQCPDGGFRYWVDNPCIGRSPVYLTAYVLHVLHVAGTLDAFVDPTAVTRGLNFLQQELRQPPPEAQFWPAWGASHAFAVKVLTEHGRNPSADIMRLVGLAERLPVFSLSHLADALAATKDRGARYQDVTRRITNAMRIDADRAHVEEVDDATLLWLWNSNTRATAVVLDGIARRKDDATFVAPLVRWLLSVRTEGRWRTTHENAMALEALAAYYRAFENDTPQMTSTVRLGPAAIGSAAFTGRSTISQQIQLSMPELLKHVTSAASPSLSISKEGTGRLYYTARMQTFAPEPPQAVDRGFQVARRFERYVTEGAAPSTTTFNAGDLVRVTVSVVLRGEGRFVALTDPVPAGFEPLDAQFQTTASDLARQATRTTTGNDPWAQWRRGAFDHVEKHDDRVIAFATRLGTGRHEFSYLVRATTAGTFRAAGSRMEAMYAPELTGRSAASTIVIK
jgi:uncharacterized protein YfaS (alpha-2-macroglobulin family)